MLVIALGVVITFAGLLILLGLAADVYPLFSSEVEKV
jgi:hypothetical protein